MSFQNRNMQDFDPQEVSLRMMAETVKRSKEYEFDNILHGRKAEK